LISDVTDVTVKHNKGYRSYNGYMARRLVEVEDGVWQRAREIACREGRSVAALVTNALRLYCATPESGTSGAMRGVPAGVDPRTGEILEPSAGHGRPAKAALEALVERVAPGTVVGPRVVKVEPVDLSRLTPAQRAIERIRQQEYFKLHPEDLAQ
jgi:hypothetical protein